MSRDDDIFYTPQDNILNATQTNAKKPQPLNLPRFEVNNRECSRSTTSTSLHAIKIAVPVFGVSYHNIQPTCNHSVLRADQNVHFSHNSSLQKLSTITPKLQILKQDYDYLSCVNTILKLTQLLKDIEKKLITMNSTLDALKQSLLPGAKAEESYRTDVNNLYVRVIEGLKECSSTIIQSFSILKNLKLNCLHELHYRKVMKKFREFDFSSSTLSTCQRIANDVKCMIENVFFLRSYFELPTREEGGYFVTTIMYNCDILLTSLQRLSLDVRNFRLHFYNQENKNSQLSNGFLFVRPLQKELQLNEGFNVNSYIKEAARWRSIITVKKIYQLMRNIFIENIKLEDFQEEKMIENGCDTDTSSQLDNGLWNHKKVPAKIKEISQSLRQNYCSLIVDEGKYFKEFMREIRENKKHVSIQSNALPSLDGRIEKIYDNVENTRVIHWSSDFSSAEGSVKELYMNHLWNEVSINLKSSFIFCCMDSCADDIFSFWFKVQDDILGNCMNKLLKDGVPDISIEALATLLGSISSYHYLQQWDLGICKAMGAKLKDKFRYSSENPGRPSSEMVTILIQNQMKQMNIHDYFKFMFQKEILHYDSKECSAISFHSLIFLPLNIFLLYLKSSLSFKRQQFLISGCWEQFFVVASIDAKVVIHFFDHLVNDIKVNLAKKSESLDWIISHLISGCSVMKIFEDQSFRLFLKAIRCRSRNCFEEHMPIGKVWRRKGYSIQQQEVNMYVDVNINTIFPPLLGNINCLSKQKAGEMIHKCIKLFIKTWMEYILDNQIMFSWYGANQLRMDFEHFLRWFGRDRYSFSADELRELVPATAVKEMGDAIMILSCQPQGKRSMSSNLTSVNPRMSTSTVSEVSVETFCGNQFDQLILEIGLHDKERWLALRVKTNQPTKFLCLS